MPKGKKGRKGRKKNKGKQAPDPNLLKEVEKTFYNLTINTLNQRYERLTTQNEEMLQKKEHLENLLKITQQETSDTINSFKRQLNDKKEETEVLSTTLKDMEEEHERQILKNEETIKSMKNEYKAEQERLVSTIKTQQGKCGALDDFKALRNEFIEKTGNKERDIIENENKHKRNMYDLNRKFIIGKDTLKKDMEMELIELSKDFQDETQSRIATSTHRTIRENIAINNELEAVSETIERLFNENMHMKNENMHLRNQIDSDEKETFNGVERSGVQLRLIRKLTIKHDMLANELVGFKDNKMEAVLLNRELDKFQTDKEKLNYYLKILEQNLHSSSCAKSSLQTELQYTTGAYTRFQNPLHECIVILKTFLKEIIPKKQKQFKQVELLENLLVVVNSVNDEIPPRPSLQSIQSVSEVYRKGDLGFTIDLVEPRTRFPTRTHKDVQVGRSFEELVAKYVPPIKKEPEISYEEEEKETMEEEEQAKKTRIDELLIEISELVMDVEQEERILFAESSQLSPISRSISETMFGDFFISDTEGQEEEEGSDHETSEELELIEEGHQEEEEGEEEEEEAVTAEEDEETTATM